MNKIINKKSESGYNYATIKLTQSRINKGLLAIPVGLISWFPNENTTIKIFIDDNLKLEKKSFTSYHSKSRECRIGGLAEWYSKVNLKDGDEVVIQLIDKNSGIYRLVLESKYIDKTRELQNNFDNSNDENEANEKLSRIAKWNDVDLELAKLGEFNRYLNSLEKKPRRVLTKRETQVSEKTPANLKLLLDKLYFGHCQVCDFWFMKKDLTPYSEVHHINRLLGNQINNLLLVCGNCHNQFTYANVVEKYRDEWLSNVSFNGKLYKVNQIVFTHKFDTPEKKLYVG